MGRIFLILIFFYAGLQSAKAQALSDKELTAFSDVFFTMKEGRQKIIAELQHTQKPSRRSTKDDYALINQQLDNKQLNPTPQQKTLIEEVKKQNTALQNAEKTLLTKQLKKHTLSQVRYAQILELYRTDLAFQRMLKPYFEKAIKKRLRNE